MEIPEALTVAEAEMMLDGVAIKIEELEGKVQMEQAFSGEHVRTSLVILDGKLCRITMRTGVKKNKFGN